MMEMKVDQLIMITLAVVKEYLQDRGQSCDAMCIHPLTCRSGFPKLFQAAAPLATRQTPSELYPIKTCELFQSENSNILLDHRQLNRIGRWGHKCRGQAGSLVFYISAPMRNICQNTIS